MANRCRIHCNLTIGYMLGECHSVVTTELMTAGWIMDPTGSIGTIHHCRALPIVEHLLGISWGQ